MFLKKEAGKRNLKMSRKKEFNQPITPSVKEGVLFFNKKNKTCFLSFLLFVAFALVSFSQNQLYTFALYLNDNVLLKIPAIVFNNTIQIPAYSKAIHTIAEFRPNKDSVRTKFSIYENICLLKKTDTNAFSGVWIKYSSKPYYLLCKVYKPYRLPSMNLDAMKQFPQQWKIKITSDKSSYASIGNFQFIKEDSIPHINGSIATPYGDLGDMNGFISNDTLYLSVFNGSFATLLASKIYNNKKTIDSIVGKIYYGNWGTETFTAWPNNNTVLKNEVPVTELFPDNFVLNHQWKDIDNNPVKIIENKPVILLMMGSWCPNCMDENKLFTEWYKNISSQVQVIALSVERTNDYSKSIDILKKYRDNLQIPYPIVLLSEKGNQIPFAHFPELKKIPAFPTTIYFDKNHHPYIITTGFNGPATHELYLQTQKYIQSIIQKITP
ncbi:MAG: thioredoxin-like domain-containing protein [Bacteroidia bacterium]|nr:thioredoxin-like domain-containing protein [Bacteroidia bacterium]